LRLFSGAAKYEYDFNSSIYSDWRTIMANYSRRTFVRNTALAASVFPILKTLADGTLAQAQAAAPVDEAAPMSKALGYVADYTKADTTRFPQAKDAIAKGSACSKCALYTQGGQKIAGKEGTYGKCSLFATGLVNENGWCMSFAAKPA
jgi:hypothetical protein